MKKKYILIGAGALIIIVCLFLFRPSSFTKKADQVFNDLNSYTLKGEMEINKGEDITPKKRARNKTHEKGKNTQTT